MLLATHGGDAVRPCPRAVAPLSSVRTTDPSGVVHQARAATRAALVAHIHAAAAYLDSARRVAAVSLLNGGSRQGVAQTTGVADYLTVLQAVVLAMAELDDVRDINGCTLPSS